MHPLQLECKPYRFLQQFFLILQNKPLLFWDFVNFENRSNQTHHRLLEHKLRTDLALI
jgi:hypothetical protein